MIELDALRAMIEQAAGFPLRSAMWDHLVKQGHIRKLSQGELSLQDLVYEIRQLRRDFQNAVPLAEGEAPRMLTPLGEEEWAGSIPYGPREEALSRLVAAEAAQDEEVVSFRADPAHGLDRGLLRWADIQRWVFEADGPAETPAQLPTWWYMAGIPIPSEYVPYADQALLSQEKVPLPPLEVRLPATEVALRRGRHVLVYAQPGHFGLRRIPTRVGGVRERLRQLGVRLAAQFGWTDAQAVVFVLTGLIPLIMPMTIDDRENEQYPGLSRLVLTIDPVLNPREVADLYRRFRQGYVGERHRDLSEKHRELALFASRQPKGRPIAKRMDEWNQQYPQWTYTEPTNFGRDSLQAQRRLLGKQSKQKGA